MLLQRSCPAAMALCLRLALHIPSYSSVHPKQMAARTSAERSSVAPLHHRLLSFHHSAPASCLAVTPSHCQSLRWTLAAPRAVCCLRKSSGASHCRHRTAAKDTSTCALLQSLTCKPQCPGMQLDPVPPTRPGSPAGPVAWSVWRLYSTRTV